MKLNPFRKKTTTGYYERLKSERTELAQQIEETKALAEAAKIDYETKRQASIDLEARHPNKPYLNEAEGRARRVRDDAYGRWEDLQREIGDLELKHNQLSWRADAPAQMEKVKQTITRLCAEREGLHDDVAKTGALITKLQDRIAALEQRMTSETQAASQSMVDAGGEFVMPEALTKLDVELRVTRATLSERQKKLGVLQDTLKLIPEQLREAKQIFGSARAVVAEIELREQLPNWIDVIALAAVSGSGHGHQYVIEIPEEVAKAARAKLAAEMPLI